MRTITAEPLTGEAFKPFGAVVEGPATAGRVYISDTLRGMNVCDECS